MVLLLRWLSGASLALFSCTSLVAQCGFDWQPGPSAGGPDRSVFDLLSLPSGDLIGAGDFLLADSTTAPGIARWNGSTWSALGGGIGSGGGVGGRVNSVIRLSNGNLVVGGAFSEADGQPADNVARWNGTSWSTMGVGLGGDVADLLQMPNGDVIACGTYFFNVPNTIYGIARWNGTVWSQVGVPPTSQARSLALTPTGDLLVGGRFIDANGSSSVMRWDGTNWTLLPEFAGANSYATHMVQGPNGSVALVGNLTVNGQPANVAIYDGVTAQGLSAPIAANTSRVHVRANGNLAISTLLTTTNTYDVLEYNGTSWTTLPSLPSNALAIIENAAGELIIGSQNTSGSSVNPVQRFDGTSWQSVGASPPPLVNQMVTSSNGDVFLGGYFAAFEGVAANNVVRFDGTNYMPLGTGVDGLVTGLSIAPDGSLVVAGSFTTAGGTPAARIARWDGQTWSPIGAGLPLSPYLPAGLLAASDDSIYVMQSNTLSRFDGSAWSTTALGGSVAIINDSVELASGEILFGGLFLNVPTVGFGVNSLVVFEPASGTFGAFPPLASFGNIAVTNGLTVLRNGDLIITGSVNVRWDGSTLTTLPTQWHGEVVELPNGDLIRGTTLGFASSTSALTRLSGNTVSAIDNVQGTVRRVALSPRGDLMAAGAIESVNGHISKNFARAVPTCRADATPFGNGCTGSAWTVTLQADSLPWLGGAYRSTATGMAPQSLVVQLFGNPSAATLLPMGAPGCTLAINPFLTTIEVPGGGIAQMAIPMPVSPTLIGYQLRQQVVGVELSGAGITQLTATNALDLTIGTL